MAHLAIIPDGIASKLLTATELARNLRAAGHRVTLLSAASLPATAHGFDHLRIDLRIRGVVSKGPWHRRQQRADTLAAGIDLDAFDTALRRLAPDAILIDIECHEAILAAQASGLPVGLINVFFNLWRRDGCPPLDSAAKPRAGRVAERVAWGRSAARTHLRTLAELWRTAGVGRAAVLEALARRLETPLAVDRKAWLIPFVQRGLPVLTLNAYELEFPHVPHPDSRYVGPLLRDATAEPAGGDSGGHERLERLLRSRAGASSGKLVYAGFGALKSTGGTSFWRTVVRAVAAEPSWMTILGLGRLVRSDQLGPLPPHVHAFDWVPQVRVLEHADCAVIHGGMTSVYECIRARVPMLVCPYRVNDQLGTAARVGFHGVGRVLDRRRATSDDVAAAVRDAGDDPELRERVAALADAVERYRTDGTVVAAVERWLAWGRPGTPPGWSDLPRAVNRPI